MRLKRPNISGPGVKRLQEMLDTAGCDFGPNDGIFGIQTDKAVRCFQKKMSALDVDGIAGPMTLKYLHRVCDAGSAPEPDSLTDIRGSHRRPKLFSRIRRWRDIAGITVHQTGCNMPSTPYGWRNLNAHIGITQEGTCVLVNEFTDMIYHAQGLSIKTIGIEVEGNFPGVKDNPRTLWKAGGPAASINSAMIRAFIKALRVVEHETERYGGKIRFINAHRQSSENRRADPGEEIWQKMVLPATLALNASDGGNDFYLGSGRPVPNEWDDHRTSRY